MQRKQTNQMSLIDSNFQMKEGCYFEITKLAGGQYTIFMNRRSDYQVPITNVVYSDGPSALRALKRHLHIIIMMIDSPLIVERVDMLVEHIVGKYLRLDK